MSSLESVWIRIRALLFSTLLRANQLVFRKALALMNLCLMLIDAEIRRLDPKLFQLGEQDEQDNVVEFVSRSLTAREQIEPAQAAAARMSEWAITLTEKARNDDRIKDVVATYFMAKAFALAQAGQAEESEQFRLEADKVIPNRRTLTAKEVYERFRLYSRQHRELRASLAERSAIKVEIRASDIVAILTIAPAVVFIAGFWYVTALVGEFGLKASLFYTVGDYVGSSLDRLSSAALSVAWSVLMIIFGLRHGSLRPRVVNEALRKRDKMPILIVALVSVLAVTAIAKALEGEFDRHSLTLLGVILSYLLAEKFAEAFSKNVLQVQLATTALLLFVTLTWSSLSSEIDDLRNARWGERVSLEIQLKNSSTLKPENLVVFAANSSYIFALNRDSKDATAIPRDQIAAFSIKKL